MNINNVENYEDDDQLLKSYHDTMDELAEFTTGTKKQAATSEYMVLPDEIPLYHDLDADNEVETETLLGDNFTPEDLIYKFGSMLCRVLKKCNSLCDGVNENNPHDLFFEIRNDELAEPGNPAKIVVVEQTKDDPVLGPIELQIFHEEIKSALPTCPNGSFKNIFRDPTIAACMKRTDPRITEIPEDASSFVRDTMDYVLSLPDVTTMLSAKNHKVAQSNLHVYFTLINFAEVLKYVEEEVEPFRQYIDHMIKWHRTHPERTIYELIQELESLPSIEPFRESIRSINDVDVFTSRGTFNDDFFLYLLCCKGHEECFHNGKVLGSSLRNGYLQKHFKGYKNRWERMVQSGIHNVDVVSIEKRGIVVDFFQNVVAINRNLHPNLPNHDLNNMGQSVMEVLFALITSGFLPIEQQPGCSIYGDLSTKSPNYQQFLDWNVMFVKFLTEHRHLPTRVESDYTHEDEAYLAHYYNLRTNRRSNGIWNRYRKDLVEAQVHKILGDVDPFGNELEPLNICRFCKQRFKNDKLKQDCAFNCCFNLSKEKMIDLLMYTLKHKQRNGAYIDWMYIVDHHGDEFQESYDHYYTAKRTASWGKITMSAWLQRTQYRRIKNSKNQSDIQIKELVQERFKEQKEKQTKKLTNWFTRK